MEFKCPNCDSKHSVPGAIFEICSGCGYSSTDYIDHSNALQQLYAMHWRDRSSDYWLKKLMQEVGELASALAGDHEDPAEWELMQIRAICGNWLRMRQEKET